MELKEVIQRQSTHHPGMARDVWEKGFSIHLTIYEGTEGEES